jgi:hypothetical protein
MSEAGIYDEATIGDRRDAVQEIESMSLQTTPRAGWPGP